MELFSDLKDEFLFSRLRHLLRNKHDVPIASKSTRSAVFMGISAIIQALVSYFFWPFLEPVFMNLHLC